MKRTELKDRGLIVFDDSFLSADVSDRRFEDCRFRPESDTTIFSIHRPFGISRAEIERTEENWSDIVMLRLHLKGLENFKVTNGIITLEAAVSNQDGKVRLWKDGYFEIQLPKALFEDNPKSITVNWIDFYR